jgi:hypothetical protein
MKSVNVIRSRRASIMQRTSFGQLPLAIVIIILGMIDDRPSANLVEGGEGRSPARRSSAGNGSRLSAKKL